MEFSNFHLISLSLILFSSIPCTLAVGFGATCVGTGQGNCDQKFLVCDSTSKVCECQEGLTYTNNACRAPIGKPCDIAGQLNPMCDTSSYLTCDNKICKCLTVGHEEDSNGKCKANLDDLCSGTSTACDRNHYLYCGRTNTCQCQEGTSLANQTECKASINSRCNTADGDTPDCDTTSYLECGSDLLCHCIPGHEEKSGNCNAIFDESCAGSSAACDRSLHLTCDIDSQNCRCDTNLLPFEGNECKLMFSKYCTTLSKPGCGDHMSCNSTLSMCRCSAGFLDNDLGRCVIPVGSNCTASGDCEALAECVGGKCKCNNGLVDNGFGLCRLKAGDVCVDGDMEKPCDTNVASCISGKCQCQSPLVDNGVGHCRQRDYFGYCEEKTGPCDERQLLICDEYTHSCKCIGGRELVNGFCRSEYNEDCTNPVTPCNTGHNLYCGTGGKCVCQEGYQINVLGSCDWVGYNGAEKVNQGFAYLFALVVISFNFRAQMS